MKVLNCIRFRPKTDCEEIVFQLIADRFFLNQPPAGLIDVSLVNNTVGEYTLIAQWENIEVFIELVNADVRIIDILRPYVIPYEDGEYFHSWSGPSIDLESFVSKKI